MQTSTVTVFVIVALAAGLVVSALVDFLRWKPAADGVRKGVVTDRMLKPLGTIKITGAAGLIVGLWLPGVGIAAAACLVVYFVLAVAAHLRKNDWAIAPALAYLALSVVVLAQLLR